MGAPWLAEGHGALWEGPWAAQRSPGTWGSMGGPRGMGLKDPWASRTRASRTQGPLGNPGGLQWGARTCNSKNLANDLKKLIDNSKNKSHKNYMTNLEKLLGKGGASNKVANLIYTRTRA